MERYIILKRLGWGVNLLHSNLCTKKRSDSFDGLLNINSTPSMPIAPSDNLTSANESTMQSANSQENSVKSGENTQNGRRKIARN